MSDSKGGGVVAGILTLGGLYWLASVIAAALVLQIFGYILLAALVGVALFSIGAALAKSWDTAMTLGIIASLGLVLLAYPPLHDTSHRIAMDWKAANPGYSNSRLPLAFAMIPAGALLGLGSPWLAFVLFTSKDRQAVWLGVPFAALALLFWALLLTLGNP